ncbi:antibiotic ABC transporter ATP-binding protein, partial [Staphylococcus aureus]|nr:antibiotic ABC transporter ATP-binding protein [Staphylococcus aureus]
MKFDGKVDIDNADNIGFLIEHPKLYDNKSGLYNLK